jgi:alpha-ketoglutarate-dependent taurine dioxygenase
MTASAPYIHTLDDRIDHTREMVRTSEELMCLIKERIASPRSPITVLNSPLPPDDIINAIRGSDLKLRTCSDGDHSVVQDRQSEIDYSQRGGFFDLHQDGMGHTQIPDLGILFCVDAGAGINPTVFCDTTEIVDGLAVQHQGRADELLSALEFVYLDKSGQETFHPLLAAHSVTGRPILNLGSRGYVRQQVAPNTPSIRDISFILSGIFALSDDATFYRHWWRNGDLVLWDNRRLLHGRAGQQKDQSRKLVRFVIDRG